MNSNDFIEHFKNLPPETPLTAAHVAAALESMSHILNKPIKKPTDFDSMSSSQLINEELLGEWISEPVKTIQYWRAKGTGPEYVKSKSGSVRYRVGTIQDWIKENTISNTAQGTARGILKFEGIEFQPPIPKIIYDGKEDDFFDSLYREDEPQGYSLTFNQFYENGQDNPAAWLYDCLYSESLQDVDIQFNEFYKAGININQTFLLLKEGIKSQSSIADMMASYQGDDINYSGFLNNLLDMGLDVSQVTNESDIFLRSMNTYNLYQKMKSDLG